MLPHRAVKADKIFTRWRQFMGHEILTDETNNGLCVNVVQLDPKLSVGPPNAFRAGVLSEYDLMAPAKLRWVQKLVILRIAEQAADMNARLVHENRISNDGFVAGNGAARSFGYQCGQLL